MDEDAYELLSTYEQSLRNYFRQREGGEEIAQDIEARIAELLDDVKQSGTEAITMEHVREVMHRIGKPEEMEEAAPLSPPEGDTDATSSDRQSEEAPSGAVGGGRTSKRLYRNPADKKMMGVLSGFAAYFGGDVLWWRLGYVGLFMLTWAFPYIMPMTIIRFVANGGRFDYTTSILMNSLLFVFLYMVFAVLMPVAETPEDRLRMKGKEVNPQNLAEEVAPAQPSQKKEEVPGHKGPAGCIGCIGGFFVALWTVITTLFRWCIYIAGAFVAVMCIVGIVSLLAIALNPSGWMEKSDLLSSPELAAVVPDLTVPFYIFVLAALLVLSITAYAIIHSLLNEFKQMPSMPYRQRIALLVMWILGLVAAGAALGYGLPRFIDADNAYNKRAWGEINARYREEHTHDGIFIEPREWEWLQDNGWRILSAEGCNDRFTTTGEYMTGDRQVRYLDCYDGHHRQRYRAERTETLQAGTYRITCAARANGTGACVYAIVGDEKPQFVEIPASGNTGGNIFLKAKEEMARLTHIADSLGVEAEIPESIRQVVKQNGDEGGFGWNRLIIQPIRITKPTIVRYGLTSDDAFTGRTWLGQWFSATDFVIERID